MSKLQRKGEPEECIIAGLSVTVSISWQVTLTRGIKKASPMMSDSLACLEFLQRCQFLSLMDFQQVYEILASPPNELSSRRT